MAQKSVLWLWLCLLAPATLANQASPASDNTCFTSDTASPEAIYDACCSITSQSGTGYVGDVQFRYQCGFSPDPANEEIQQKVGSIQNCAALCAAKADCVAGTWDYLDSRCYLTNKINGPAKRSDGWVLLEKVRPGSQEVEAALKKCRKDRDNCQTTLDTCTANLEAAYTAKAQLKRQKEALEKELQTCQSDGPTDMIINDFSSLCPGKDGQQIQAVNGRIYQLSCFTGDDSKQYKPYWVKTFQECLEYCSEDMEDCQAGLAYWFEPGAKPSCLALRSGNPVFLPHSKIVRAIPVHK
ncbi:hypothetical protein CNMCM5623_006342 [Aspergillus felis]|uniref:Apple domain-containing protein n=1 Tax=Aspergillus felis TaxID=1287682 RepID=A0A8H6V3L4_9EURO|nr:hypothetical protein CNMCM5623_006342 [Aspergillus felis]